MGCICYETIVMSKKNRLGTVNQFLDIPGSLPTRSLEGESTSDSTAYIYPKIELSFIKVYFKQPLDIEISRASILFVDENNLHYRIACEV